MQLDNPTLGQLDRLASLGCRLTIRDGKAHAPLAGLLVAAVSSVIHRFRVWSLRGFWLQNRHLDRCSRLGPDAFWASYLVTRYRCRDTLPSSWFRRA